MERDLLARVRSAVFDELQPADAPPQPFVKGLERLEVIGKGSFGTVFRARDRALDKEVALKVLERQGARGEVERFLREARILASIDHPNVVRVSSIDEAAGEIVICMELVPGQTLEDRVAASGPLSAAEAAQLGIDLCKALAAIHAKGLIHGDLKHANVMRSHGGRIVLLDFGLSRFVAGPRAAHELPASPRGTPLFMAPEAFESPASVDPRADLYSLGVLLYWLVCARYPIEAKELGELRERLRGRRAARLRDRRADLPAGFVRAVEHLLGHHPEDRPASAGAAEAELAASLTDGGGAGRGPAAEFRPSRRLLLGVACTAAVAIPAGLALRWSHPLRGGEGPTQERARLLLQQGLGRVELSRHPTVARGDLLMLEVTPEYEAYLYLLNEDLDGRLSLLFPRAGCSQANPLSGGKTIELPRACGGEPGFTFDGGTRTGGRDSLLLVLSFAPLDWIAPEVERAQVARAARLARSQGGDEAPGLEPYSPLAAELGRLFPFLAALAERLRLEPGVALERWEIAAR